MGVTLHTVLFEGPAPALAVIVDAVQRRAGIPLSVHESRPDDADGLHEFHARLAFAAAPDAPIEVYAYRPGAVKAFSEKLFPDGAFPPLTDSVEGIREPHGAQAVYVRGYVGQEPTLWYATIVALEALGGRPEPDIDDDERRMYGALVSERDLVARHRKVKRAGWWAAAVAAPFVLVLVPLTLLWSGITMPWHVWRTYRAYRAFRPKGTRSKT